MARYIEAADVIGILQKHFDETDLSALSDAAKEINLLPSADVAPVVYGKWMWVQSMSEDEYELRCSKCKSICNGIYDEEDEMYRYHPTAFCPNCGADMRKAVE